MKNRGDVHLSSILAARKHQENRRYAASMKVQSLVGAELLRGARRIMRGRHARSQAIKLAMTPWRHCRMATCIGGGGGIGSEIHSRPCGRRVAHQHEAEEAFIFTLRWRRAKPLA